MAADVARIGKKVLVALALVPAMACAAPDTVFVDGFEQTIVYDIAFSPNAVIGPSTALIANLNVPAGSYVAFVRMQLITGSAAPATSFRLDCTLAPGFDSGVYTIGVETSVERYLTFQGAKTLASASNIQFSCHDGNGNTSTLLSGKLTVMSASAVN
ncbi:MAG: hypothetical protein ABIQ70_04385 [Dokdonella sp.]